MASLGFPHTMPSFRRRAIGLALFAMLLAVCFGRPLFELVNYAWNSELFSHVLLVPFITAYLIWCKRREVPISGGAPSPALAALPFLIGALLLAGYAWGIRSGWRPPLEDYLALMTLSCWCFLLGGGFFFLGIATLRNLAFPIAFLVFMAPLPVAVLGWISDFLQYRSADTAYFLLRLSGMPVLRNGTFFQLPGFQMEVAPQCSGIHSTLVLLITSLLAGYLLLSGPWRRAALALAVIPLALLRNGFRIFVIGQLCVQSPDMIHSYIHKQGGPIFFALSLVPLFLLLLFLRRGERKLAAETQRPLQGDTTSL
jgi:exosortase C (VPDSG-CTERM-specific)